MTFQIHGLNPIAFAPLFEQTDAELAKRHITRCFADAAQGFPCRVSLDEAPVGEELLLLNYEHLTLASPYRATHAIYVARRSQEKMPNVGAVPHSMQLRPLSLRAFGSDGMMRAADLADHETLSDRLTDMLSHDDIAFVHIHNAKQGCYAALATRPDQLKQTWLGARPEVVQ